VVKDHPVFASLYDRMARSAERFEGEYRDELCGDAEGLVLELGSGSGLNFTRYGRAKRVVGVEPEPNMLRRSIPRARQAPIPVSVVRAAAEVLPFPDATFDSAVTSLVLCSVTDQAKAISELRRVLKPGGVVRFYEHVRSERPRTAKWQDRLERPWGFFAGGCHPNRDTLSALRSAGFAVRFRAFDPPMLGGGFIPHVLGEASRFAPIEGSEGS
jgi:ubiquinone/menaquinone biosynthesis C-methylase UbiE